LSAKRFLSSVCFLVYVLARKRRRRRRRTASKFAAAPARTARGRGGCRCLLSCRAVPCRTCSVSKYEDFCGFLVSWCVHAGRGCADWIDRTAVPDSLMTMHAHARFKVGRVETEVALVRKGRPKAVVVVEHHRWVRGLVGGTSSTLGTPQRSLAFSTVVRCCCDVFCCDVFFSRA